MKLPQALRLALMAFLVARSWLGASAVVAWVEPRHVWPLGRWLALLTGGRFHKRGLWERVGGMGFARGAVAGADDR